MEGNNKDKEKQIEIVKEIDIISDAEELLKEKKDSLNNYTLEAKKNLVCEDPKTYWGTILLKYKNPENEEKKYKEIKYVRSENGIGYLSDKDINTEQYNERKVTLEPIGVIPKDILQSQEETESEVIAEYFESLKRSSSQLINLEELDQAKIIEEVLLETEDNLEDLILKGITDLVLIENGRQYEGSVLFKHKYPVNKEKEYKFIKYSGNNQKIIETETEEINQKEYLEKKLFHNCVDEEEEPIPDVNRLLNLVLIKSNVDLEKYEVKETEGPFVDTETEEYSGKITLKKRRVSSEEIHYHFINYTGNTEGQIELEVVSSESNPPSDTNKQLEKESPTNKQFESQANLFVTTDYSTSSTSDNEEEQDEYKTPERLNTIPEEEIHKEGTPVSSGSSGNQGDISSPDPITGEGTSKNKQEIITKNKQENPFIIPTPLSRTVSIESNRNYQYYNEEDDQVLTDYLEEQELSEETKTIIYNEYIGNPTKENSDKLKKLEKLQREINKIREKEKELEEIAEEENISEENKQRNETETSEGYISDDSNKIRINLETSDTEHTIDPFTNTTTMASKSSFNFNYNPSTKTKNIKKFGDCRIECTKKNINLELKVIDEEPNYCLKGLDNTVETFKINGLPFWRVEGSNDEWYNDIESYRYYKEDDTEGLPIPMKLVWNNSFEDVTEDQREQIRLGKIKEQAEKLSSTPMGQLNDDQVKIVNEYNRLQMEKLGKEMETLKRKNRFNQGIISQVEEQNDSWTSWLGDPFRETGRDKPQFQETLKIYEEKPRKEIPLVDHEGNPLKPEDMTALNTMATMLKAVIGGQEKKWTEFPLFNEEDDPYDWIQEFQIACETNGFEGDRRLQIIPSLLQGNAKRWWLAVKPNIKTFGIKQGDKNEGQDSFVRNFIERFAGIDKQYEWDRKLNKIKQEIGETVSNYTDRWMSALKRADPRGAMLEYSKINKYIEGLRGEIRKDVMIQNPKSLRDAQTKARTIESAISYQNGDDVMEERIKNLEQMLVKTFVATTGNTSTNTNNTNNTRYNNNSGITCNYCKKQGHRANECRSRINVQQGNNTQFQQRNNGQYQGNNTQQRVLTCYNCNKTGHISKNCNAPRRNQPTCQKCGKRGHYTDKCYAQNNQNNRNQSFQQRNGRTVRTFYANDDEEEEEDQYSTQQQLVNVVSELADKVKHLKV